VLTETTGQVDIDVPRDQAGTFKLQIVKKRQRRLTGVDEVVLSLYVKGLPPVRCQPTWPTFTVPRCRRKPSPGLLAAGQSIRLVTRTLYEWGSNSHNALSQTTTVKSLPARNTN